MGVGLKVIESDGFKLSCIIEGRGFPALVIGSSLYYQRVFPQDLREHLQLIFADHRGFVPQPSRNTDKSSFDLPVLLNDIEKIRKELCLEKPLIIGHSGHAFLALEYAKKYPQNVSGVVMIAVTPDYSTLTHEVADGFFHKEASVERKKLFDKNMQSLPAKIDNDPERKFVHYCVAAGPKSWYDESFDASSLWEGVYTNMQMIDYVWGEVFHDIDITQGLNEFKKPVLLILGKYDFLTGPAHLWDAVQSSFNDLTIEVFEKSAHTPPYEEPGRYSASLLKWIADKGIKYK
jgi:proline iminopeptidase